MRAKLTAVLIAMVAPFAASAQGPDGGGAGPGRSSRGGGQGARLFDPGTVTTLQGDVVEIRRVPGARRGEGVHLVVAAGTEKLVVHLGPSSFVDRQGLKLANGDQVEVKGSRVVLDGTPTLIAPEITRGKESMVLRDASGVPLWARGRGWAR
jgi:hypothetical protein